MRNVDLVEVFAVLNVLEPILTESLALRVWLFVAKKSRVSNKHSAECKGETADPQNAIARCKARQPDPIDSALVKDGRRIPDTCEEAAESASRRVARRAAGSPHPR